MKKRSSPKVLICPLRWRRNLVIPLSFVISSFSLNGAPFPYPDAQTFWHKFQRQTTKSKYLNALLSRVDSLKSRDPNQALALAQKADSLAIVWNRKYERAQASFWLAWLKHYEGVAISSRPALIDAQISLDLCSQLDSPYWLARSHAILAAIYSDLQQSKEAGTQLRKARFFAVQIRNQLQDSLLISGMLHSIRAVQPELSTHSSIGALKKAIADYSAAGDWISCARAYKNLALFYDQLGLDQPEMAAFQQAIQIYQKEAATRGLRMALVHFSDFYIRRFEQNPTRDEYFTKAIGYLNQARALGLDLEVFLQFGASYHHKVRTLPLASTLRPIYIDSARYYYQLALEEAPSCQNTNNLNHLAHDLMLIAPLTDEGTAYLKKMSRAYNTLLAAEHADIERAQLRLWDYEKDKNLRQKKIFRLNIVSAVLFVLLVLGLFLFIAQRRLFTTKLKLWQARLSPHFISNAMNSIDALIGDGQTQAASNYLIKFNRFCRNTLDASDTTTVSLAHELDTLRWYLDLEKLRLGERLNYVIEVDERIEAKNLRIPLLLLQPYAENAIWHGIHPQPEGGTLHISVKLASKNQLCLSIADDGVGLESSKILQGNLNRKHRSWGMDISKERTKALSWVNGFSVKVSGRKESKGTLVTILLPIKRHYLQKN